MRDITKIMTGTFVAGAALLVAACGGGISEANNTADANAIGTDVYGTDMNGGMTGNMGDTNMGGTTDGTVSNDLSNASNAVSNAADAVNSAASNAQ